MAVCQNLVPLVNIKIAGKWMFIPLKMVLIGIDPYPYSTQKPKWSQFGGFETHPGHSGAAEHGHPSAATRGSAQAAGGGAWANVAGELS